MAKTVSSRALARGCEDAAVHQHLISLTHCILMSTFGTFSVHQDTRVLRVLGKTSMKKKRFLSGIAQMMWGGSTHVRIFGPLFRSAFLVNKKSLFLQKCQCIELLTVF